MKKRELEDKVARLSEDMWSCSSEKFRYKLGVIERLGNIEALFDKLEAAVGEELPRLFTRIEELERARVDLEAALVRVEGDKARQPDSVEGRLRLAEDRATTLWDEVYNDAMGDLGMLTRLERAEAGLRKLEGGNRPFMTTPDPDELERWRRGHTVDLSDKARQPDEPMADMPETCPDCDDEYPGECATCKPEAGPSDDGYWVNHELHEQVVAQRDEARAERDAASLVYDALLKGKKHDRLREGIERLARLYETYEPAEVGRKRAMELRNHARDLRALLDGDDE